MESGIEIVLLIWTVSCWGNVAVVGIPLTQTNGKDKFGHCEYREVLCRWKEVSEYRGYSNCKIFIIRPLGNGKSDCARGSPTTTFFLSKKHHHKRERVCAETTLSTYLTYQRSSPKH